MTDRPRAFADEYATAVSDYLEHPDEASLERAYDLGRRAVADGLGVLDLTAVHAQEVDRRDSVAPEPLAAMRAKANAFFAEALAPYEMALRGFREANAALLASTETLEKRVAERTRELEAAKAALHEKNHVLGRILESISDAIVVVDPSRKILLANGAAARLAGLDEAPCDLETWPSTIAYRPDMVTRVPPEELPLARALRGEHTEPMTLFVQTSASAGLHVSAVGSPLRDEEGRLLGGVAAFRDDTDRRAAEDSLRRSEARLRTLFEATPIPMWTYDVDSLAFVSVNEAAVRQYGYSRAEFAKLTLADIRPNEDVPALHADVSGPTRPLQPLAWRHRRKDGSLLVAEVMGNDLELEGRRLRLVVAYDVTEREKTQQTLRKTEEQLRQSQKMDAIGRLAGGVAHDFNNILSVIISYAQMLLADLKPNEPMREDIEEIHKAGRRAAELTRQLLTFSRQQVLEPRVLDLNDVLTGMDKMLQRILGADVDLVSLRSEKLGRVLADPGGIEQVILNLVVNARDAMPAGGQLTVELANVELDESYASEHPEVKPGPFVMLAVTDTGTGMDRATMSRIFEPFFTTKEKGKGTGLGLSTVFGIVQQNGGSVWVYSELGRGTTFKIYLPRVHADVHASVAPASPRALRGTETILMVDDDEQVRIVVRSILARNGYDVLEARNAGEALLRSEMHRGKIHLLLTDVVMPGVSGPELARRLAAGRPDMKVLCMSGYTADAAVRHHVVQERVAYVQKPVTPESLTMKVREVLDDER